MASSPLLSFAAPATPSDAGELEVYYDSLITPEDEEIDYTPTALTIADGDYTLDYLYDYFKTKVVSDLASASDAVEAPGGAAPDPDVDPAVPVDSGIYLLDDALPLAAETEMLDVRQ